MKKTNFAFMAFASGKESTEGNAVKRYIGVGSVFVLAVNPNKAELEKLYNTQLENDPEYLGEVEVGEDKHKVQNVRLDFIVKTDAEKCGGIEFTTKVAFFIRKEYRYNRNQTKVQVIDKYGRTAWVTVEQAKAHEIPVYKNGPANIDKDFRPAYHGEEELTNFIKAYLNIPNVMKYVNNTWVMVDKPEDCEARLESIAEYFKGNFKELRDVIALQPNNKVKVLFGVRTTDDNKQYQAVYNQMFLKNNITDYSKLDADLQERKAAGAYPTTEFTVGDLKEYDVESTDLSNSGAAGLGLVEPLDAMPVTPTTPHVDGVYINNLKATGANIAALLSGLPESIVQNVVLQDVEIESQMGIQARYVSGAIINTKVESADGKPIVRGPDYRMREAR